LTKTDGTTRAILLVADISGYTGFVREHARSASHARQIVSRLLRSVISAASPPLLVNEIEGDAVFFYALGEERALPELAGDIREQIPRLFRSFTHEMNLLSRKPRCSCRACAGIGELRLKQVVHTGEVATEKIDRFDKLFGLEVIVVHRMLKNSVPAQEYLMISEAAFSLFGDFFGLTPEVRMETLDGLGAMGMRVYYPHQLAELQRRLDQEDPMPPPSAWQHLQWRFILALRTLQDWITVGA